MNGTEKKEDDLKLSTPSALASDFKILGKKLKAGIKNILSIRPGTDIKGTIAGINRDINFKGHTAWILIASIFIASIGLNTNSTAVIVGAMLISPLMGPILGIGLAVGTNDWELLIKALKNFGIAIFISLLTSAFYFWISPLSSAGSELLSRTKPTILDVLIASFGGFAGIIAGSRYEKNNVIPGVAIATALMPPLCTAGYGLATSQYSYFLGAFYLFFLNSVFISLATFIMVRYFRFPVKHLLNKNVEKKFKRYIIIFVSIIILPSAFLFWEVIQESRFVSSANKFVQENIHFKGSELINNKLTYSDSLSLIDLYIIGDQIEQSKIDSLSQLLNNYGLIAGKKWTSQIFSITRKTQIKIHQAKDNTQALMSQINDISTNLSEKLRKGIIEDLYSKNEQLLQAKNKEIINLKFQLRKFKSDSLPIHSLKNEIKAQYPEIDQFWIGNNIFEIKNDSTIDTLPVVLIKWMPKVHQWQRAKYNKKIANWLKYRLAKDTVKVINY